MHAAAPATAAEKLLKGSPPLSSRLQARESGDPDDLARQNRKLIRNSQGAAQFAVAQVGRRGALSVLPPSAPPFRAGSPFIGPAEPHVYVGACAQNAICHKFAFCKTGGLVLTALCAPPRRQVDMDMGEVGGVFQTIQETVGGYYLVQGGTACQLSGRVTCSSCSSGSCGMARCHPRPARRPCPASQGCADHPAPPPAAATPICRATTWGPATLLTSGSLACGTPSSIEGPRLAQQLEGPKGTAWPFSCNHNNTASPSSLLGGSGQPPPAASSGALPGPAQLSRPGWHTPAQPGPPPASLPACINA